MMMGIKISKCLIFFIHNFFVVPFFLSLYPYSFTENDAFPSLFLTIKIKQEVKEMKWNEVIYADCMNEENGLPTLEDKSIDLCIADPPFNIQFKGKAFSSKKTMLYKDNKLDYKEWCESWFHELKRVCKGILIFPGNLNLWMWSDIEHPRDLIIHYKKNCQSRTSTSYLSKYNSILVYGKLKKLFSVNVIEQKLRYEPVSIHPCPDCYKLYFKILQQLQPQSVIDPFMGSGTTAEACTKLGIPWIGYEINEVYSHDINKRLKGCVREPQQIPLPI